MFLPNYRAWVIVFSLAVCLATWYVIERTRLGSYLRAATENPALVQAFGINVPRMITLTYGFGVGLAALAGVLAAPIYQVNPLMGADLIIVVFAVVVIGGLGSIMGSIVTGFGLGVVEGFTKVFYPEASNTVIFVIMAVVLLVRPAGLFGRARRDSRTSESVRRRDRTATVPGDARRRHVVAFVVMATVLVVGAVLRLPGVPHEGALLRALRLRLQPAHRLRRAPVVRPRGLPRLGRLRDRARREGVGLSAGAGDPLRDRGGGRRSASSSARSRSGARASTSRTSRWRSRRWSSSSALQATFTGGEDGIQAVPRGTLLGVLDLRQTLTHVLRRARDLPARLPLDLPRDPLAVRPGPEGHPRERAARDLARLPRRAVQAARVRALGDALPGLAGGDQGHRLPARVAHRRALDDVGRGRAHDAARRPRHGLRPGGRAPSS